MSPLEVTAQYHAPSAAVGFPRLLAKLMATDRADTDIEMLPLELGFLPPLSRRRLGVVRELPLLDIVADGGVVNSQVPRYLSLAGPLEEPVAEI